jgi:hypothetical protein
MNQDDGYRSDIEVSEAGATIGSDFVEQVCMPHSSDETYRQANELENMMSEDPLNHKSHEQTS